MYPLGFTASTDLFMYSYLPRNDEDAIVWNKRVELPTRTNMTDRIPVAASAAAYAVHSLAGRLPIPTPV